MIWDIEGWELHLVILRILKALVQVKAEKSGLIQIDQHLPHQQPPMEQEPSMLVLLVHLMLVVVEVSTKKNMLFRNGSTYNRIEFINQYHVL
jgi:hypothetical protein